jgi:hypothetical protein
MVLLDGNFAVGCGAWNGLPLNTYRVIKKSLSTWWLQYRKLQVMFKVSPASLQTFIDTPNCVLEDRVQSSTVHIPNVFCDGHLQIINFVGIVRVHWVFHQAHRDFWSPSTFQCMLERTDAITNEVLEPISFVLAYITVVLRFLSFVYVFLLPLSLLFFSALAPNDVEIQRAAFCALSDRPADFSCTEPFDCKLLWKGTNMCYLEHRPQLSFCL